MGPLKICLISEPLDAGVGRHVVETACDLSDRGNEVHLLYSPLRLDRNFLATLQRHPAIRCQAIAMPRGIGWADVPAFLKIRNYVKANGPFDIVHGQSSKGGGYARLLKLAGLARTVIYSPHAFITFSPVLPLKKRVIYHGLEFLLAKLTDVIVCSSQVEREHGIGLGVSQRKLRIITNGSAAGPKTGRDECRAALGLKPHQVVIGFIGRMEDQKAPEYLIDAALPLLRELPDLHLLLIGDGPKRHALEVRLRVAGLGNRVSWMGAVDARQLTSAMDIFALSSLYEGFAYVLIEALQASLPIVSTPVGGTHESVSTGENGFIVPHGSPGEMAAALRRLACDAGLRDRMAHASAERAGRFTVARMVDAIERLYYRKAVTATGHRPQEVVTVPATLVGEGQSALAPN